MLQYNSTVAHHALKGSLRGLKLCLSGQLHNSQREYLILDAMRETDAKKHLTLLL